MSSGISTTEQQEIARALKRMVPDRTAARKAYETGSALDRDLWGMVAEMGLFGAALPEELGGVGVGLAAEITAAETLAYAAVPLPITAVFTAAHILAECDTLAGKTLARILASGERVIGAALPADAMLGIPMTVESKGGSATISGKMGLVMDGAALDVLLVHGDGRWWAVEARGEGVSREEPRSLDATRRLAAFSFDHASAIAVSAARAEAVYATAWTLLSAELVAVAQAALQLSAEYSLTRRQFGEPIGLFQAIKHKLADCLVAVEGARSALAGAVHSAVRGTPDLRAARLAKIAASSAGVQVAHEAIQIYGAIGTTWEHDLHLLLRRAKSTQHLLGSDNLHHGILGRDLLEEAGARHRSGKPRSPSWGEDELSLRPEDREFIAEFRAWLDRHATPSRLGQLRTRDVKTLQLWQAEMAEGGWAGVHWPAAYGGREATFIQQVLYHAESADRGLPPLIGNRGLSLMGPTLIAHGTDDQKARFVEATRRGDILWSTGFSEPGAGSDLAALRTRGVVDGNDIIVNGQKIWTTGAQFNHWLYTLIRTGPLEPKRAGLSCVVIPLNAPGLTVRPIRRLNGDHHFNEVFFDNVRVPIANLVGALNNGWNVTRTTLAHEHSTNFLGAQLRQAALVERLVVRLARREAIAGVDHVLRSRMTQVWINTQILRLHGLRNITNIRESGEPGAEGSIMKLCGQEEERRLYELQVDICGAEGLTQERLDRVYLGARTATIGGGTSEVHRNKIAERVLGMPRDLWADD